MLRSRERAFIKATTSSVSERTSALQKNYRQRRDRERLRERNRMEAISDDPMLQRMSDIFMDVEHDEL